MKIAVHNLLGVEQAVFAVPRIALIGGVNGAGKSSILEAVSCVIRGEHETRGVRTKRDAGTLVRSGAPAGSATIEWEDGKARVVWPDAKAEQSGTPRFLGTALGIGAARWMDLSEKKRLDEMAERLRLAPTKADLEAFLRDYHTRKNPDGDDAAADAPQPVKPETIDAVWKLVEEQGWDAAHTKASEQVKALRARWEERSRSRFGASKSRTWRPPLLDETQTYTVEGAEATLREKRAEVERLVAAGAVSAEDVARTRAESEGLGPAKAQEEALRAKLAKLDAALEAERATLAGMPDIFEPIHTIPCPHCAKPLWLNRPSPSEPYRIETPPPERPAAEIKEARVRKQAVAQGIDHMTRDVNGTQRELQDVVARIRAAEAATKRLAELEAAPPVTDADLAEARAQEAQAEQVLSAVRDWMACKTIYAEWERSQPILAALDPTGVRAARVGEVITAFNAQLATLSAIAGWGDVAMTPDGGLTMRGRPYHLLSESERWRADLTVTLALAQMEKPALVLVDRLDVLHPQARPGVFQLLAHVGVPALVCCTAKDAAALPPLHKVKVPGTDEVFGRTFWLENGRLAPVE